MDDQAVLTLFRESGAFLEGHFLLSSGLHSPHYIQCARIFEDPEVASLLAEELASKVSPHGGEWVVGPALGGILLAYELARKLHAKAAFTERIDGKMEIRRGFSIPRGSKALIAEDVLTTGGSVLEAAEALKACQVLVTGIAALVNRTGVKLPYPTTALLNLNLRAEEPASCLLCREGKPLVKPGSRALPHHA